MNILKKSFLLSLLCLIPGNAKLFAKNDAPVVQQSAVTADTEKSQEEIAAEKWWQSKPLWLGLGSFAMYMLGWWHGRNEGFEYGEKSCDALHERWKKHFDQCKQKCREADKVARKHYIKIGQYIEKSRIKLQKMYAQNQQTLQKRHTEFEASAQALGLFLNDLNRDDLFNRLAACPSWQAVLQHGRHVEGPITAEEHHLHNLLAYAHLRDSVENVEPTTADVATGTE